MKMQCLALVAFVLASGSIAQASSARACIDSKGGTYSVGSKNQMKCENNRCELEDGINLSDLYEEGAVSTLDEKDSAIAHELALSLQPLVSGPMIQGSGNEPKLYLAPGLSVFCSSEMTSEDYYDANISQRLSESR